jgi:hypothetical protein
MSLLSYTSGGDVMVRPVRSIGGLYPGVVVEESHEDALEITEHPVEQGAAVNDHAFKKPQVVTIRAGVSDSVEWGGDRPSVEFYEKLLELQQKREPFDIITGKRQYKNMLIATLSVTTDEATENCLLFSAECREVIIVRTQAVSVPPRKNQAKAAKTGATADKGQKQPQRKSMLKAGLG